MEVKILFPTRLKELRKKKKLTQSELGEKVGVKQNTFTNWENGKREPSLENIIKLAKILDTTTDDLLGAINVDTKGGGMATFTERLKALRQKNNLTQKELADILGVSQGAYQKWEKGKREPNFENLLKLAAVLNTTTSYLLGEVDESIRIAKID